MIKKILLRPDRLRQIPPHFSWVDHQLIRQHRLRDCEHTAWALYLFLVSVGDAQGLSYYSDAALGRALKLDPLEVPRVRRQLIQAELIAYRKPLYQVLALVEPRTAPASPAGGSAPSGSARSAADILRQVLSAQGGAL
jgi:hypothetical protein